MPRDTRSPDGAVVEFENVSKTFHSPKGPVHAVNGLTMELRPGQTIAFLGPNGAGKSTSIDMLLGLSRPSSGTVRVFGKSPRRRHQAGHGRGDAPVRRPDQRRDGAELVKLMAKLHPRPMPVAEVLKRANIADIADRRADKLSGGQTQRVRFAIAIIGDSRPDRAGRADHRHGRGEPAGVLAGDEVRGGAGQDDPVRHALPGGGRPDRRPGDRDQQGPAAGRRHRRRHQGAGRRQAHVLPAAGGHPRPAADAAEPGLARSGQATT